MTEVARPEDEEVKALKDRVALLEGILRCSPCTCMTYGRASFPPSPDDYSTRQWCGRCRVLGFDKNPEPKPSFVFPNQLVIS